MNATTLRRARRCMPITTSAFTSAFIAGAALTGAQAARHPALQHHALQHGESIASLARRYHVSVQDIAQANNLKNVDSVRDGFNLVIPPRPKHLDLSATFHKTAIARADRIGVRLGPGPEYRKVDACDKGAIILVTAEHDGWAQVQLENGRVGWIRHDFIKYKNAGDESGDRSAGAVHHEKSEHVAEQREHHAKKVHLAEQAERREHSHRTAHESHKAHGRHHEVREAQSREHHHASEVAHRSRRGVRLFAEADRPRAGNDIVRTAYSYRGTPYVYGAAGRGAFDCSGFTSFVYRRHGVNLPHSARGQFETGRHVSKSDLKAGDLVFFHTVTSGISHVGMYVGNGKFVHASSRRSGGVRVDSLASGYYNSAYRGARRVK